MIRFITRTVLLIGMLHAAMAGWAQPLRPPESPSEQAPAGAEPGYLGLVADDRQENGRGARLMEVVADGPAAQAGLQQGDLITAIDGRPVRSLDDMGAMLQPLPPGAKIVFSVERQGTSQQVEVTLGHRPTSQQRRFPSFGRIPEALAGQAPSTFNDPAQQTGPGVPRGLLLGVRTMPVTPQTQMRLRLPSITGAHVVARTLGSPAEKANIPLDAVITAIDDTPIGSPLELSNLLSQAGAGREIELTYFYNGNTVRSKITLGLPTSSSAPGVAPPRPGSELPPPGEIMQPVQTDAQRIEALEHRIRELEQKVRALEEKLQRST